MAPTVDIQLNIRFRNAQLVEKHIGHIGIKVLTGMQNDLINALSLLNGSGNNAGFYELGACADYGKNSLHE